MRDCDTYSVPRHFVMSPEISSGGGQHHIRLVSKMLHEEFVHKDFVFFSQLFTLLSLEFMILLHWVGLRLIAEV